MKLLLQNFAILVCPLCFFPVTSFAGECYSYPIYSAGHGIRQDLEEQYQRRYTYYEQGRGTDMQAWLDTARFAFEIYFAFVHVGDTVPDPDNPKGGYQPDPDSIPVDTLSPKAWKAWTDVLFSKYPVYDYHHPDQRMFAPAEPEDFITELLTTRASLLAISGECFTRALESGFPRKPAHTRRISPKTGIPMDASRYGADGRKSAGARVREPKALFRK